jgi:hypothetical protein
VKKVDRTAILLLAAEAQLDPRTVKHAIEKGISSLRAAVDRERLRAAAKKLGVALS